MYRDIGDDLCSIIEATENQAIIRPIREVNFYDRWLSDVENATNRVEITYFDNKDPRSSTDPTKSDYYEDLSETIARKSAEGVEFRRIVRAIPNHKDWIDNMIGEHEGTSRFSLACIPDKEPEEAEKPHVSVQLIDDEITYFVAVGEQRETSEPRDMFVRSAEMNTQWSRYYEKLWNDSFVVLRRGQLNQTQYDRFEEHVDGLRDRD
jgi:hypothetical protein